MECRAGRKQVIPQQEHSQVQGWARARNRAEPEGSSPNPGWGHKQDGHHRLAALGQVPPGVFSCPQLQFPKIVELPDVSFWWKPRYPPHWAHDATRKTVRSGEWSQKPLLATVPSVLCPPQEHSPCLCSHPFHLGICICTSGPREGTKGRRS